jgi:uncharacterized protein
MRLAAALLAGACTNAPPPDDSAYFTQVELDRQEKDAAFRTGADSPIPADRRTELLPLAYFPITARYRVAASLAPRPNEPAVEMPTSTGKRRMMRRAGHLEFLLEGQSHRLTAFVDAEDRQAARLFVPFRDATSGTETYIAGRYLDLERTPTGLYDLDFNRAYIPYCYYNSTYDCPLPPRENRLSVRVEAGERLKS